MYQAHNSLMDDINIDEQEIMLAEGPLINDKEFLKMLEMNVEQLTHFLEERILDNPFIEMEYSLEQFAETLEMTHTMKPQPSKELESDIEEKQSLETYLFQQIMLYRHTDIRDVMLKLVSLLDEHGYLPYELDNLVEKLDMDPITVLDGLTLFKQLEPAGIGGKDLREVMMLQTEQDDLAPQYAYLLLDRYYDAIKNESFDKISEAINISRDIIDECLNYYKTLTRQPAAMFIKAEKQHLIPDVIVQSRKGQLTLGYNRNASARIYFNEDYYNEMRQYEEEDITEYLSQQVNNYRLLAEKVRSREELLMRLMQYLVNEQRHFFLKKEAKIKSLTVKNLAKKMEIPEGYIYRLLSHKKLKFNQHQYALSDFINMKYSIGREGLSAQKIKERIQHVLKASNQEMTDQEVVELLKNEGIRISDNIVGMYRANLILEDN